MSKELVLEATEGTVFPGLCSSVVSSCVLRALGTPPTPRRVGDKSRGQEARGKTQIAERKLKISTSSCQGLTFSRGTIHKELKPCLLLPQPLQGYAHTADPGTEADKEVLS